VNLVRRVNKESRVLEEKMEILVLLENRGL
jgi:hypothetical protein